MTAAGTGGGTELKWLLWAGWIVGGLLIALAVATGLLTLFGKLEPHVGAALTPILVVLGTASSQLQRIQGFVSKQQAARQKQLQQEADRQRELDGLTVYRQAVRDAKPIDLGVSRSRLVEEVERTTGRSAYVPRKEDAEIRKYLRDGETLVLIVGDSKAGKSRSAFEAIRNAETGLSDHILIAPNRFALRPDTLTRTFELLNTAELGTKPTVLWLENLDRYLDAGSLSPTLLSAWRQGRPAVVVMATMRRGEYDRLRFSSLDRTQASEKKSDVTAQARDVLDQAQVVRLPTRLQTDSEKDAAARLFGERDWGTVGLGEALILGPQLIQKLQLATCPNAAVVCGVIDWRRTGMSRPIEQKEVEELWPSYLKLLECKQATTSTLDEALAWAIEPLADTESALLVLHGPDQYVAADYVESYRDGHGEPGEYQGVIPLPTWTWVVGTASPEEALAVGLVASSHAEYQIALEAWAVAERSDDGSIAARAVFSKGVTSGQLGRPEDEIAAYEQVDARFGQDATPSIREQVAKALLNKGLTLIDVDKAMDAIAAFDQVAARFGPDAEGAVRELVAGALLSKGVALGELGQPDEEMAAYNQVDAKFGQDAAPAVRELVARALLYKGEVLGQLGKSDEEIASYTQIDTRFGQDRESGMREVVAGALQSKGVALGDAGKADEEIAAYDEVETRYGQDRSPGLREVVAEALLNKGLAIGQMGKGELEINLYEQVVARFGQDPEPALREAVATALVYRAITLTELNKQEEAITAFAEVDTRFGQDPAPALREQLARALLNKGLALGQLGKSDQEIAVYDEVVARFGQDARPEVRTQVATALLNKGLSLGQLGKPAEEVAAYEELNARFSRETEPALRELLASALLNKGVTLGDMKRPIEEIAAYEQVDARFGQDTEPAVREQVAGALLSKGVALGEQGKPEEEIAAYDQVDERFGQDPRPEIRERVAGALSYKGDALGKLGKPDEQIAIYSEADARFGQDREPAVRELVAGALQSKAAALAGLGKREEAIATYDQLVSRYGQDGEADVKELVAAALAERRTLSPPRT